jgi:hypothetical protein
LQIVGRKAYPYSALCRRPDYADPDTARVAQREISTGGIGTILFGCLAASGPFPRLACCFPILGQGIGVKGLARMRFSPSGQPCVSSHLNSRLLTSVPYERVCDLSDYADLAGLQPCSAGASRNDVRITRGRRNRYICVHPSHSECRGCRHAERGQLFEWTPVAVEDVGDRLIRRS